MITNFKQFLEGAIVQNNPNTSSGYRDYLTKQSTQKVPLKKPNIINQVKPLPSQTDDIEAIKTEVEQQRADLTQTKTDIEKMQIDGFEVDNQKEVADKIDQYKKKTDEVTNLVNTFDKSIKTIKKENQPAKREFRSNIAGARTKKYL